MNSFFDTLVKYAPIVSALTPFVLIASAYFVWRQLQRMRHSTDLQAFLLIMQYQQDEKMRKYRQVLFKLENKPYGEWKTDDDKVWAAEEVCQNWNSIGLLVRLGALPRRFVFPGAHETILQSRKIADPLIKERRIRLGAKKPKNVLWADFDWLANEAEKEKQKDDPSYTPVTYPLVD